MRLPTLKCLGYGQTWFLRETQVASAYLMHPVLAAFAAKECGRGRQAVECSWWMDEPQRRMILPPLAVHRAFTRQTTAFSRRDTLSPLMRLAIQVTILESAEAEEANN